MSWVHNPLKLVLSVPTWPTAHTSSTDRQDALAQILFVVAVSIAAYRKSLVPIAAALSIMLLNFLLWECDKQALQLMEFPTVVSQQQQHPRRLIKICEEQENDAQLKNHILNKQQATHNVPRNGVLPWSPQSYQYPNNPGAFDYGQAVRGATCAPNQMRVPAHNQLARMYNSPEMRGFDNMVAPLPDPTFMARQPFCHKSPFTTSNDFMDEGRLRLLK